jgi:tetratricopeptide (TPR) repeat protein
VLPAWSQTNSGETPSTASTNASASSTAAQLIEVEKLARQAVFEEVQADSSSYDGIISEHIRRLVSLMTAVGDREGIRQLQPLLRDNYADEFARQTAPAATVKDFRIRLAAAEKLTDKYRRDDDVKFIIERELEKNMLGEAAKAVDKLVIHLDRTRALDQVSTAYRKAGDTTKARDFLNQAIAEASIRDSEQMALSPEEQLQDIADHHQEEDDAEGARLALAKLLELNAGNPPQFQSGAKSRAAQLYARLGDYDRARQLIDTTSDDVDLSGSQGTRAQVAYREAIGADPKRGLALAAALEDPEFRADAFLEIAAKQSKSGDSAGASNTLFQALAAARETDQFRDRVMANIASAWADLGNLPRAKQTLEEALSIDQQNPGWTEEDYIAIAFADLEDFDRALEIAGHLDRGTSYAYRNIAYDQVKAGQLQRVLDWIGSLKDLEAKVEVLLNVCDALQEQ